MNQPTPLVHPSTVMTWQRAAWDVVLLDCRFELTDPDAGRRQYEASHPVGAIYAHLDRDLAGARGSDPTHASFTGRHPLPDRAAMAATLGRWGITPASTVITLDAQGAPYASRAWWLLRWMGHTKVYVLDGGLDAWLQADGPTTSKPTLRPAQPPYPLLPQGMPLTTADALMAALPSSHIVDARSADRFRGDNESLDPVAGHLPGARNRWFKDNLDATGRFKTPELLRLEWQALLGTSTPTALVQQCGSGVTACQNMVAAMHAGLPPGVLYAGSWSEWCANPSRPRATGD